MSATDPAVIAARDQAGAACRDAALAADAWVTEAFTTWLHKTLIAHGRTLGCPHHLTPQVLAVLIIGRASMLCCLPCRTALIELAGPSDAWICDRCRHQDHRPQRHPTRVTAAVGPVLAHIDLCAYCAFDLDITPDPSRAGHPQEGSTS